MNILQSGTFNAGFVGVSDVPVTRAALAWWQDRLLADCSAAVERGVYYDQRWLDLLPILFDDVSVMRDAGCNIAYWNLPERHVQVSSEGIILADGAPARFFHFSGFEPEQPSIPSRYSTLRWDASVRRCRQVIYKQYAELLLAAGHDGTAARSTASTTSTTAHPFRPRLETLYKSLGATAADFGDPFQTNRPDSYFRWLSDNHPDASSAFPKHFRGEAVDDRTVFPGVGREAGLATRLAQELLGAPAPLGRHLRKEQTPVPSLLDDEAVQPDRQRAGRTGIDAFERPEHGDLDRQAGKIRCGDGREAGVLARGVGRAARDLAREIADTSRACPDTRGAVRRASG